jgi:hypothetical protein
MSVPMSQVLATARTYLNDDNSTQFPDPVLIPKIQEAHRELQTELWVVGSPLVRNQGLIVTPTITTDVTKLLSPDGSGNYLLTDFLCPTALFEAPNSVGGQFQAGWTPMTEAFYIPIGYIPTSTIQWWMWRDEIVYIGPCTISPKNIIIQYRRNIPIPAVSTDLIGILYGEAYLAARAAAIAAGSVGNAEVFAALTSVAKEQLSKVITANRGQQKPNIKP